MRKLFFGEPRQPHSDEALETSQNDSLMPLLELVPSDAFGQARNRWMDQAPSAETFCGVIGATAMVGAKRELVASGAVDRRLDFINLLTEHSELL
jgi:hypothetical protein